MWSRYRARSLRVALAGVIFAVMLGIRIGPVPDDDNDPVVDYGPHLSNSLPRQSESTANAAPAKQQAGERPAAHRAPGHRLHTRLVQRRLHTQASPPY